MTAVSNSQQALAQRPAASPTSVPEHSSLAGYDVQVDGIDRAQWDALIESFDDASIYQTWAYEEERSSTAHMSHVVLRKDGSAVAAAQLRIVKLFGLPLGIAYSRWGPMWCCAGVPTQLEHLRAMLQALRNEYVGRRGLALRLLPLAFEDQRDSVEPILKATQFEHLPNEPRQRTLLLSLQQPLDALRRNLDQKWRNGLNRAEKNGLTLHAGSDEALFDTFLGIYRQMHERKSFQETSDVTEFLRTQRRLPPRAQLRVALAYQGNTPVAGLVCSLVGDTGIYLYGATGDAGLSSKASYLLQWNTIEWLHERGARWYNLHGINPATNPGTYHFKAGLAGRAGIDQHYLGTYQATPHALSRVLMLAVGTARKGLRRLRQQRSSASQRARE
jgi:lipid II:glycine glycyltransferase (peptidoglycan interpeptide bridge formation enzyme)